MRLVFFSILSVVLCGLSYAQSEAPAGVMQEVKQEELAPSVATQVIQPNSEASPVSEQALESSIEAPPAAPVPPKMEAPKLEEAPSAEPSAIEEVDVEGKGAFDTIDLSGEPEGNWLIKRIWWEKAESKYEKAKALVDQIMEMRMDFFTKRNEVEHKILEPFYMQSSLSQGQLEEIVSYLLKQLNREQEGAHTMLPKERELYEALQAEGRVLEQLKLDVEAIRKIDIAIDDALTTLMEQINLCRAYEKEAWNAFKGIAKVLDHNKARELYYSMDASISSIKNIDSYIKNALSQHFNSLVSTAQQQVERVKSAMQALKEKGIDLKQQVTLLEAQEHAAQTEQEQPAQPVTPEDEDEEEQAPRGWFGSIWYGITDFFGSIWYGITDFFGSIWYLISSWWR